jgi:hypothetical protein
MGMQWEVPTRIVAAPDCVGTGQADAESCESVGDSEPALWWRQPKPIDRRGYQRFAPIHFER